MNIVFAAVMTPCAVGPARRAAAIGSAIAVALLALTGCAAGGIAVSAGDETGNWEVFHAQYPDVPKPEITVIRTVEYDERDAVISECLHEAGFPDVQVDENGGLSWKTSQPEAFDLAHYICLEQYPLDPKYTARISDEQLGELYDYFTLVQVPCLEALGIDIPEAPSKTRFIETYLDAPEWLPYAYVMGPDVPAEASEQAVEQCPQNPPPGSEYDLLS